MNLTTGELQRHPVVWIREMPDEDIKSIGETGPTIDSIHWSRNFNRMPISGND